MATRPRPQAVIFDLDNTLVTPNTDAGERAIADVCRLLAETYSGLDSAALRLGHSEFRPRRWRDNDFAKSGHAIMKGVWQDALQAQGFTDEAIIDHAHQLWWDQRDGLIEIYEDVRPLLAVLAGLRLAVITNGPRDTQLDKLQVHQIENNFELFLASGEIGLAKPDPAIFRHALDKLGVAAEDAWYVGDSLANDVAGAQAAGLTAVWLNRHGSTRTPADPQPDIEISSLTDLLNHLH